jgi:type IV pilus assembly protein PilM
MENPFKKLFGGGLSIFSSTTKESVIGVDIGSSAIKVVQVRRKGGKALLETYGSLSLGPYGGGEVGMATNLTEDKISAALTDLMRESSVTTNDAGVAIPSSASLVTVIDIPGQVNESDLGNIVQTEARKYIPVPMSEVSLDWFVVPSHEAQFDDTTNTEASVDPKEKTQVLIAAIHNDTVSKYQTIVKNSSVVASFYEIEIFSVMRSVLGHEMGTVLIVDFGASKVKLSIVDYGVMRQFHVIMRGSQDITNNIAKSMEVPFAKAEQLKREFDVRGVANDATSINIREIVKLSFDFILNEVNSVVLNYQRRYNKVISKVILVGGGSLIKGFYEAAQVNFQAEVVYGNAFAKVEAPAFLEAILSQTGPEFAVAVGLALRKLQ